MKKNNRYSINNLRNGSVIFDRFSRIKGKRLERSMDWLG